MSEYRNAGGAAVPETENAGPAEVSLEQMFEELDAILTAMDSQETTLDQAFALYEKGMLTLRRCNEKLDLVEKKMQVIAQNGALESFGE